MHRHIINHSFPNKSLQALMHYKYSTFYKNKAQANGLINMALITLAMFSISLSKGAGNGVLAFVLEAIVFIFLVRKIKL